MTAPSMSSVREQREAIVQRHIAAENAGDVDGTVATFDRPRYNVVPMAAICEGADAVRMLVGGLVAAFPDFRFRVARIHHGEDAVIVEGTMTGTQAGDWAAIPSSGAAMEVPAVCIFDFEGTRLMNETVYFDYATLQRQLS